MTAMRPLLVFVALLLGGCSTSSAATGPTPCNGQTCKVGEACVVTTSGGGPCIMPDDAGVCPNGTHSTGCCDNTTTTYACQALPAACGGALADAGVLQCQCLYP